MPDLSLIHIYEKLYKAYYLQVYSYTISLAKNREIAEAVSYTHLTGGCLVDQRPDFCGNLHHTVSSSFTL